MATAAHTGGGTVRRGYDWREELRLDTMDIVVATILGLIEAAIEIVGALGFLERTVWLAGPAGFAFYAFYNGTTWILFFAGVYLRKRAGVMVLAIAITHLVRWFFGDPDGPILMFYALFPAFFALLAVMTVRWRNEMAVFLWMGAVAAATNQIAAFIGQGGMHLAGGWGWGLASIAVGFLGGLLWGAVGRYLGIGLEKAGVPVVEEPPALTGGTARSYA